MTLHSKYHYSPKRAMPDSLDIEIANMPPDTLGIKLDQNQPNPFVNLTEIQYFVSQQVPVKLVLYDYNGREIAVLIDKYIKPGWHSLIVNGSGLNTGVYILKFEAAGKSAFKQIQKIN